MKLPTAHLLPHGKIVTPLHLGAAGCVVGINAGYYTLFTLIGIPLVPMFGLGAAVLAGSIMSGSAFIDAHTHTEN